jgi:murein DD-endopeptidase MepM/ murein hydrolase activator NlpD
MSSNNIYSLPCDKKDIQVAISDPRAHFGIQKHAVDFALPEGSEIIAAQAGKVVRLRQDSDEGGQDEKYRTSPEYLNKVTLEHKNEEYSEYSHLQYRGAKVSIGEEVEQGQVIARSGNTGYTTRPHLHFQVLHEVKKDPGWETIEIQWKNPPEVSKEKHGDREVAYYTFS